MIPICAIIPCLVLLLHPNRRPTVFFGIGPKYPVKIFIGLFTINNSISRGAGMSTHALCLVAAVNSVIFDRPPCLTGLEESPVLVSGRRCLNG